MKKNELTGKMNVRRKLGGTGAIEGTVTDPTEAFSHKSPLRARGSTLVRPDNRGCRASQKFFQVKIVLARGMQPSWDV